MCCTLLFQPPFQHLSWNFFFLSAVPTTLLLLPALLLGRGKQSGVCTQTDGEQPTLPDFHPGKHSCSDENTHDSGMTKCELLKLGTVKAASYHWASTVKRFRHRCFSSDVNSLHLSVWVGGDILCFSRVCIKVVHWWVSKGRHFHKKHRQFSGVFLWLLKAFIWNALM